MSHQTISQSTQDLSLLNRVQAAIAKEAWANEALGATPTGQSVRNIGPSSQLNYFIWPIAIDNEAAYEYAVNADNPNPGGDPGVITDAALSAGVQVHWPEPAVGPTE